MEAMWYRFNPMVVEPGVTIHVTFEVKVDGSPTAVRLELASTSSEMELRDDGIAPDAAPKMEKTDLLLASSLFAENDVSFEFLIQGELKWVD